MDNVSVGGDIRDDTITGLYCKEGHTGPLCEVCVDDDSYLRVTDGNCIKCPRPLIVLATLVGILLGAAVIGITAAYLIKKKLPNFLDLISRLSLRAKFKLLVSFYQVINTFELAYGISVSSKLTSYLNIVSFFSLDLIRITGIPIQCIGTTVQQLLLTTLWPFIFIGLLFSGALVTFLVYLRQQPYLNSHDNNNNTTNAGSVITTSQQKKSRIEVLQKQVIQWTIILLYFTLPLVSQRIFDAIKCRAFDIDDNDPPSTISYLLLDMRIECNTGNDPIYRNIITTFWILFSLWIVIIPLGFYVFLKYISPSIEAQKFTSLTVACRFLWEDYTRSMWFWDIVDVMRKLLLTGIIMMIDPEEGSNKMLRLVVAIVISILYLCVSLIFQPYRRRDDFFLAFVSNLILLGCFSLSIILKLCGDEDESQFSNGTTCRSLVNSSFDPFQASLLVVILIIGIMVVTVLSVIYLAIKTITAEHVSVVSTGHTPDLKLPGECNYHIFMSHVWATGQSKTHAIARKLKLLLPQLQVWLDVDLLDDASKLEVYVESTLVFFLFYSTGYFESKNCRREIYAAIEMDKPIIVVYNGNESVLGTMRNEIKSHCNSTNVEKILQRLLGDSESPNNIPIQWLDEGSFSVAAMKEIYHRIFTHLPYYIQYPQQLNKGIKVPGELGLFSLQGEINILIHEGNQGCRELVHEIKRIDMTQSRKIRVTNAAILLENTGSHSSAQDDESDQHNDDENPPQDNQTLVSTNALIRSTIEHQSQTQNLLSAPTFMLVYLNSHTFSGNDQDTKELEEILKICLLDKNIHVVLVQEKDVSKGGCDFGEFFKEAPRSLINAPYYIFKDIAIPLYKTEEYRIISLTQILIKMGAKPDVAQHWMRRSVSIKK
jgi:hypothetical protein